MIDKKVKILIVDDNIQNIQVIMNILKDKDYSLFFSTNAKQTFNQIKKNSFDLILLDIMMPDMCGFEVCSILKDDKKTENIPIIFLSAKQDSKDVVDGFKLGGVDYIKKPFNTDELLARVNTHLENYLLKKELEQNLINQAKMAMMGEMINIIAHQFKQPLNVISLITQDLDFKIDYNHEDLTFKDVKELNSKVFNEVTFLSNTINSFRDFFKDDKITKQFYIDKVLSDSVNLFDFDLKYSNIKFKLEISSKKLLVNGSKNEFLQVVLNLINNAKDAICISGLRKDAKISLSLSSKNKKVILSIIDSAGGIKESVIEKIFENRFTTKGELGNGIGLYISKMIIENRMGGEIKAKNIKNGAKFTVVLDLAN